MQPVCIMAALENELREILTHITIEKIERFGMTKFYIGKLDDKAVVVTETNWGVVPATMAAITAISRYQPSAILVTGISGALAEGMGRGDVVIVDATYNHNFEMISPQGRHPLPIPYHDRLGRFTALRRVASDKTLVEIATNAAQKLGVPSSQYPNNAPRYWVGASVAGEAMTFEKAERLRLGKAYNAIAVDMETIGQAHVALTFDVPYLAVRQISDTIFDDMVFEETRWASVQDQHAIDYSPEELAQIATNGSRQSWQSQPVVVFDEGKSWAVTAAKIVLETAREYNLNGER
jgi:adenosylhomocysteine nucleosidase